LIELEFSEPILDFNLEEIYEQCLNVSLSVQEALKAIENTENSENIEIKNNYNFTWNASRFDDKVIKIQIIFEDPYVISLNLNYDVIEVQFLNNATKFIAQETNMTLDESSWNLTRKVGPQIGNSNLVKGLAIAIQIESKFIQIFFWLTMLFTFVASNDK
jgi:hypothetical protein